MIALPFAFVTNLWIDRVSVEATNLKQSSPPRQTQNLDQMRSIVAKFS